MAPLGPLALALRLVHGRHARRYVGLLAGAFGPLLLIGLVLLVT
jgi:hypothetical protein